MVTVSERGRPADILLIDDNPGDAMLIQIAFKRTQLPTQVTIADTAEAGLNLLQMPTGDVRPRRPDIVFRSSTLLD